MTVYRMGKPINPDTATVQLSTPAPAKAAKARTPCIDDCWSWLPPHRLRIIVDQAYKTAQANMQPDDGAPFVDEDGRPWADAGSFFDCLTDEINSLLLLRMGQKRTMLTPEMDALRCVGKATS